MDLSGASAARSLHLTAKFPRLFPRFSDRCGTTNIRERKGGKKKREVSRVIIIFAAREGIGGRGGRRGGTLTAIFQKGAQGTAGLCSGGQKLQGGAINRRRRSFEPNITPSNDIHRRKIPKWTVGLAQSIYLYMGWLPIPWCERELCLEGMGGRRRRRLSSRAPLKTQDNLLRELYSQRLFLSE